MIKRSSLLLFTLGALLLAGCQSSTPTATPTTPQAAVPDARTQVTADNNDFLTRKTYDPWLLTRSSGESGPPVYLGYGRSGMLVDSTGAMTQTIQAGNYVNNNLHTGPASGSQTMLGAGSGLVQQLNLKSGIFAMQSATGSMSIPSGRVWANVWATSDIAIDGDTEAQQVVHSNLFYLLSSTAKGLRNSIPPMGLSSTMYGGHIFWDADTWMFPVLIVQHPDDARSIIDYRFDRLAQARKNASADGFPGAEYPWESAATGAEVAPKEFAQERHINADVALAAWQYYLWTADASYLRTEGWPILQATAAYWTKRATPGADGAWHILKVLPPDETAGVVDDDAYTNASVRAALQAATTAAGIVGQPADPKWRTIASKLTIVMDKSLGIPAEYAGMPPNLSAKQADTLLLLHPLDVPCSDAVAGKMLDYYKTHTITVGPAMTSGIHAVVAARLGRGPESLDDFRDSYRPFMRGPFNAFSEKRTTSNVYFLTGMAASLQSVLYGFAGLQVAPAGTDGQGTKLAGDSVASLYADPHLPPGWGKLVVQGIHFRGHTLNLTITAGNKVTVQAG